MSLLNLEAEVLNEENAFFKNKMLIQTTLPKEEYLRLIKEDQANLNRICYEYEMNLASVGDKKILKCNLSSLQTKYVRAVAESLSHGTNLNFFSTVVGKSAEMAFSNCINSFFNLFRINKRLRLNTRNFVYGGDGGADFFFSNMAFDIKYRDDSPGHGMILEQSFLDRTNDDLLLIHVTNSSNIKLGHRDPDNKVLPLAISGWVSVKDFKAKANVINNNRGSLVLDKLNPITDLIFLAIEEQLKSEQLFEFPNLS